MNVTKLSYRLGKVLFVAMCVIERGNIMKALFTKSLVAGAIALSTVTTALAADITGAGATFPYPIYAKWAEAYKAKTKNGLNYQSIGSSGGYQADQSKNS